MRFFHRPKPDANAKETTVEHRKRVGWRCSPSGVLKRTLDPIVWYDKPAGSRKGNTATQLVPRIVGMARCGPILWYGRLAGSRKGNTATQLVPGIVGMARRCSPIGLRIHQGHQQLPVFHLIPHRHAKFANGAIPRRGNAMFHLHRFQYQQ